MMRHLKWSVDVTLAMPAKMCVAFKESHDVFATQASHFTMFVIMLGLSLLVLGSGFDPGSGP